MPKFYARLENTEGDFRELTIYAASIDDARATAIRRELKFVIFRLSPDKVAEIEAKIEDGTATKPEKVDLQLHNQAEPFELTYIGETRQGRKAKAEAAE